MIKWYHREKNMKEIIVIPSYEPDNRLIELIKTIDLKQYTVIVVDDGSGEKYHHFYEQLDKHVHLISYNRNRGKGYALKKAFNYIKENIKEEYVVVTMDSDGQHIISDAKKLLTYAKKNPYTYVLGMRKRDGKTPLRSRIGNSLTMFCYRFVTGKKVYDTQTGLRAFSNKLMDFLLGVSGNRFEYEMKCLLEIPKSDILIHEIEINTIYYEKNKGSHFKVIRDSYLIYKDFFKVSLAFIICLIYDYLMFIFIFLITRNILYSNIISGMTSLICYGILNWENIVQSERDCTRLFIKYFPLAIIVLFFNTFVLNIFVNNFLINNYVAKIIVNIIFVSFYYLIHRSIIYKK